MIDVETVIIYKSFITIWPCLFTQLLPIKNMMPNNVLQCVWTKLPAYCLNTDGHIQITVSLME